MGTRVLDCPKCGTMQVFRELNKEERAAVRAEMKNPRYYVDNLWRCTAKGCRTYFPQFHKAGYGLLPEEFGDEAAAGK
ncbi:hypothetical protein ACIBAG_08065 [Streptomyces sp. NPDC051243]|uniref:hypothetical protein n=1 Tax=Streptomyces sp. NPDC051243 TaxID=3365646 RepID=UPI00378C277E